MRIAIVSGDDIVGDDPQELSAALAARGNAVTRFVRQNRRRPAGIGTCGHRTVSISVGPRSTNSDLDVLPYVGDWAGALADEWSAEAPDVVHAYGWLGGLAAQLAARRQGVPAVQSFLGLATAGAAPSPMGAPAEGERLRVEPLLARSANWVTGESSDDVDALARLRRSRARVSALTSGVDVERYNSSGPAQARTDLHRIVCLAPNPKPCNGFDIVIRALARVPGTELVLAETEASNRECDEARLKLQLLGAGLGVSDRVRFAGTVSGDRLAMLLRSADVVACTPRQPPRATAVLQAMACGVVVVAYGVGVLRDAVVDNVTGLVLRPETPTQLPAALRSLLAQRFQCMSMGSAGRSRALSRYAWDRIALDCLNIYQRAGSTTWMPQRLQSSGIR
ncbi:MULTISPECIES: glycosyltransferase [unclassified Mycobacterium]|uniref:glycosyltransferase n=1 Tax=unclassified Mycobacterium TaxID=2642494 RepID=UPI0007FCFE81|nr:MULTISPECIES: glycosyltransferase [unclassified Mycobacterium]OBG67217.1 glycosyl transferase family 1 [Mycobacterium sp. E735]OBG68114.1 glycosyl transferase family 1 [Mycobacterium sp. E188]OBG68767.1 glycosyl transferase family 1 [Mycobacterium sp. E3305]OBH19640.1 glycosyl transferase family 1 [Mycobacterium sp. E1715]OBH39115.1 glycosyl transferase family 1 [Mycobacterium sp. E183]